MTTPKKLSAETQPSGSTEITPSQLLTENQAAVSKKQSVNVEIAIKQFEVIKAELRGPQPMYPLPKLNEKAAQTVPTIQPKS